MAVYRRASRRRYVLLMLVLTGVTLITLDSRNDDSGPIGAAGRVAHQVVGPVERAVDSVANPVGDWFEGVTEGHSLKRDNERLHRQLAELEEEGRRAEAVLRENKLLHEQLDLPILDDVPRVTAQVVNTAPGNFEWTVTLDKGTDDGISPDMPVVTSNATLVGKVVEAWADGCKVLLLRDSSSAVAVRIVQEPVTGVAQGRAGVSDLVVDLDAAAKVAIGDIIETSGTEGSTFPAGLLVGEVTTVEEESGGFGKLVRVAPFVDFERLEFVTVLRWVPGQGPVVEASTTTTTAVTTTTLPGSTTITVPAG